MTPLERDIERKLVGVVKHHGGLCLKWVCPGWAGVPDRIVLLGDLLYHGPRNDLPRDYAPKQVIAMLSPYKDKILCVRGNCEAEVDQMVLPFPVMADYAVIALGDRVIYATHGHKFGPDNPPPLTDGDILLSGHTHVPMDEMREIPEGQIRCLNPGSVSIPKENSAHGYLILTEDDVIRGAL